MNDEVKDEDDDELRSNLPAGYCPSMRCLKKMFERRRD